MKNKNSFLEKLPFLLEHLYLKYVLAFQRIRRRRLVNEAHVFAKTLADSLFPELQKIRQPNITIKIEPARGIFLLADKNAPPALQEFQQSKDITYFLYDIGIRTIELDTLLEENQITDALKVLFHAGKNFTKPHPPQTTPRVHNSSNLAATISSETGLNKFCANIRFDKSSGILCIRYSYCELFYTFTINTIIDRYTKTKNHQAIFALAPKIGFAIGLLFFLHHIFWTPYSTTGIIVAMFGSLAFGAGFTYLTNTIASVLYDQEHRDKLLQENLKEITALSHIPGHNPSPIMKISDTGAILFANSAAENMAKKMGFSNKEIAEILPPNYLELVNRCLEEQQEIIDFEVSKKVHTLRFNFSPFPNEKTVLASGTDITRLKQLEIELRQLNTNLEEKVLARTEELAQTQDITILSLSSLAETRDPETGAHIQRTRLYVKILAEHLSHALSYQKDIPSEEFIDLLYRSAPLHDIGKVGIPDSILLKPGKLNDVEFEIMKRHPVIGGDSLKWAAKKLGENSFLKLAREIAYGHHEKWDGSGYPYGLVAEQIPISCRLMALADVYDALVNKRVYKEEYSHEKAKDIIIKRKGSHFDPDVVDAFLVLEKEFINIAVAHKDHE